MKHPKLRKDIIAAAIITFFYLLLLIFKYHLSKFLPGMPFKIFTIGTQLILCIFIIAQVYKLFTKKKKSRRSSVLRPVHFLPIFICLFGLLYTFSPVKIDSEKLESNVILRGCYDGSTERALIKFRKNNKFEIKWSNYEENEDWYTGTYHQNRDSLFLSYDEKSPEKIGGTLLNTGLSLISVNNPKQLNKFNIIFTIGYCKDANGREIEN